MLLCQVSLRLQLGQSLGWTGTPGSCPSGMPLWFCCSYASTWQVLLGRGAHSGGWLTWFPVRYSPWRFASLVLQSYTYVVSDWNHWIEIRRFKILEIKSGLNYEINFETSDLNLTALICRLRDCTQSRSVPQHDVHVPRRSSPCSATWSLASSSSSPSLWSSWPHLWDSSCLRPRAFPLKTWPACGGHTPTSPDLSTMMMITITIVPMEFCN